MYISWVEYLTDVAEYILIPKYAEQKYDSYMIYRKECPVGIRNKYNHKKVDIAACCCNGDLNTDNFEEESWDVLCFEIKTSSTDVNTGLGRNFYGNYNYLVIPSHAYNAGVKLRDKLFPYVDIIIINGDIGELFLDLNNVNNLI